MYRGLQIPDPVLVGKKEEKIMASEYVESIIDKELFGVEEDE